MNSKLILVSLIFVGASCADDKTINHGVSGSTKTMLPSAATIETPANLELASSVLSLKTTGTGSWGCNYDNAGANTTTNTTTTQSPNIMSLSTDGHAQLFTTPSYMKVSTLTLRVRKLNGPSGNMFAQLFASSGADPSGSALSTSADVLIGSIPGTATGDPMTFTLPSAVELSSGTTYAIVLRPQAAGLTADGANNFRWQTNNAATSPTGCSAFSDYRDSTDSGATWAAGTAGLRSIFTVDAETHALSGSASWIVSGASSGSVWTMSTFTFSENPGGLFGGTITYDVGVGSSSSSATYSSTGKTLAQVKALSNLTGQYLYVRANFAVASPGYDQAALGNGSITYQ